MIIAREKKKENIVEYVLYMWYVEDMIRANRFDLELIKENIVCRFGLPENTLQQMIDWYRGLIDRMKEEELEKSGHLASLTEQVHRMNDFHLNLINDLNEPQYRQAYYLAEPHIAELKTKSAPGATEMEVCLNALYMLMMMRMKGNAPSCRQPFPSAIQLL